MVVVVVVVAVVLVVLVLLAVVVAVVVVEGFMGAFRINARFFDVDDPSFETQTQRSNTPERRALLARRPG